MNKHFDRLAGALSGELPMVVIVTAALALGFSFFLLWRYRRAVVKSMRRRGRADLLEQRSYLPPDEPHPAPQGELSFTFAGSDRLESAGAKTPLYRRARRRPWIAAVVWTIAGIGFAATMAAAWLLSAKIALVPPRFAYLTWAYAWPVALAANLVAAATRGGRLIGLSLYLLCGIVLGMLMLDRFPDSSIAELAYLWLDANAIPSLLLLCFLNRRMRAVGPLVLLFMIFGAAGAVLFTSITGSHPKLLRALSEFTHSLGLGPAGTTRGLQLVGFAALAIVGLIVVDSLRQMYERKIISAQGLTIDALWLLFGTINSLGLISRGPRWMASGLAAFVVYKTLAGLGFWLWHLGKPDTGRRLLLLRVLPPHRRSGAVYGMLGKRWRTVGSIQLVAGSALKTIAVEPHEFLDFIAGKLARRFIDSGQTLDLRISQMDLRADGDGRFRITEFFCHDDTWKITLPRLADESDAVLMDLRGLTQGNARCVAEIHELFNLVALERIAFVIDDSTDQAFMRQTMEQAWRRTKDLSPNRRAHAGRVTLVQLNSSGAFNALLQYLCAAASGLTRREAAKPPSPAADPQEFSW